MAPPRARSRDRDARARSCRAPTGNSCYGVTILRALHSGPSGNRGVQAREIDRWRAPVPNLLAEGTRHPRDSGDSLVGITARRVPQRASAVLVQHRCAGRGTGRLTRLAVGRPSRMDRGLRVLLPVWPAAWAAMAISARVLFPISLAWLWLAPGAAAAFMALATIPVYYQRPRASTGGIIALVGTIIVSATTGRLLPTRNVRRCPRRIRSPSRFPRSNPARGICRRAGGDRTRRECADSVVKRLDHGAVGAPDVDG